MNNSLENNEEQENEQDQLNDVFKATTTEIAHITAVLSSITAVGTQGKVFISSDGIIFVCENSHTIRVSATFDKSIFDQYFFGPNPQDNKEMAARIFHEDETDVSLSENDNLSQKVKRLREHAKETIKICLDLTKVVESFNIASSLNKAARDENITVKCTLSYKGYGHPFVISFRDPIMTETCEFATFVDMDNDRENGVEILQLDVSSLVMEVVLEADVIHDALNNLKDLNSDELYMYASNRATNQRTLDNGRVETNQLLFISKGEIGYSRFIFSDLEKLVLRKFDEDNYEFNEVKNDFVAGVYKFEMFRKIMKSVRLSSKIRIRKDYNGIISIHLLTACNTDTALMNPKTGPAFRNNEMQPINRHKQAYNGTVIEFVLLELAVHDDENIGENMDKNEIIELINHAENVATINPRNKKRKTRKNNNTKTAQASNLSARDHNIFQILKSKGKAIQQSDAQSYGASMGRNKGINDILHDITLDNGAGPLENGFLDVEDEDENRGNDEGNRENDDDVTLFF